MYTGILVLVVVLVIFFVIVPIVNGKLSFWQLAAKKPDLVFMMIYEIMMFGL